jgi:8-oxo-dGTP pyrophosphatase MutT (NUDIX family)
VKRAKVLGIQYAALPYRIVGRQVDILLITSRQTKRWVIPKGWPMEELRPEEAAALEAAEEAGILGEVESKPVGSYRYLKRLKAERTTAVQAIVFPLLVEDQAEEWKEQGQREARWFRYRQAARQVAETGLKHLILEFGRARTPGLLVTLGSRTSATVRSLIRPGPSRLSA